MELDGEDAKIDDATFRLCLLQLKDVFPELADMSPECANLIFRSLGNGEGLSKAELIKWLKNDDIRIADVEAAKGGKTPIRRKPEAGFSARRPSPPNTEGVLSPSVIFQSVSEAELSKNASTLSEEEQILSYQEEMSSQLQEMTGKIERRGSRADEHRNIFRKGDQRRWSETEIKDLNEEMQEEMRKLQVEEEKRREELRREGTGSPRRLPAKRSQSFTNLTRPRSKSQIKRTRHSSYTNLPNPRRKRSSTLGAGSARSLSESRSTSPLFKKSSSGSLHKGSARSPFPSKLSPPSSAAGSNLRKTSTQLLRVTIPVGGADPLASGHGGSSGNRSSGNRSTGNGSSGRRLGSGTPAAMALESLESATGIEPSGFQQYWDEDPNDRFTITQDDPVWSKMWKKWRKPFSRKALRHIAFQAANVLLTICTTTILWLLVLLSIILMPLCCVGILTLYTTMELAVFFCNLENRLTQFFYPQTALPSIRASNKRGSTNTFKSMLKNTLMEPVCQRALLHGLFLRAPTALLPGIATLLLGFMLFGLLLPILLLATPSYFTNGRVCVFGSVQEGDCKGWQVNTFGDVFLLSLILISVLPFFIRLNSGCAYQSADLSRRELKFIGGEAERAGLLKKPVKPKQFGQHGTAELSQFNSKITSKISRSQPQADHQHDSAGRLPREQFSSNG